MNSKILAITMLVVGGTIQAGFIQTVAEMPGKAVNATGTIVKDVVTAPEEIIKDTVTAPAKVIGAVPMEENMEAATPQATQVTPTVQPVQEMPTAQQKEIAEMKITQTQEPIILYEEEDTILEETPQEDTEVEPNEQ
jgi:cytoskeletal protein RodZ